MKKSIIPIIVILGIILGVFYVFRDTTPSISVISPKISDVVTAGSVQQIKWTTNNIPSSYKISVLIRRVPPPPLQEEGQEFDPIVFVNLPNTGSVDWTVSDMYPEGRYILDLTAYESVPVTNPISAESGVFSIEKSELIGGSRDVNGCLTPAGYAFDEEVGACIRAFDMTPDIKAAAGLAVKSIGRAYALTVVSFNSYEEVGAYDIMFEKGEEREKTTVYIRGGKVVTKPN